ncbi:CDP-alcohol phosphatidyltransferase-domain-containing protein [Kockovaella imperatae]|uniref:CDP-alcohol phosphatidyltransferase-domain-containing protein n=1 Tax=Kockovaella imperatae TaxID=4999 RepID=A0A1Y1UBE3_9TREE|nr:CDP-alcohol phosphatidyltransferase-domain-containing protein [Kockovaella imperatae]ORX35322.1 CDP-alcohol phosphatidyltransferase-domain-containing protein [Kockovaella imperatae]
MAPTTRSKQSTPERQNAGSSSSTSTAVKSQTLDGEKGLRVREGSRARQEDVVDPNYALGLANRSHENVYLFVPNVIGYIRVVTAAASLYIMPTHPKVCTFIYFISCILDVFDGMAARKLGQESKFGAVLDMVTDRCATACLLCFLSATYTNHSLLIMFLITLDFSSHYIHMYSSLVTGSSSHKAVTSDVSRILWYYYHNRNVLFTVCFANEVCFVCAYLAFYEKTPIHSSVLIKYLSHLLPVRQILYHTPAPLDYLLETLGNVTWAQLVFWLTAPVCALKQVINVVQFWKASKILVGVDLAERQAAREAAARAARGR